MYSFSPRSLSSSDYDPLGLPDDQQFWLVKYIDQFNRRPARPRSTTVKVLLQRLDCDTLDQVKRQVEASTQSVLGTRRGDQIPVFKLVSCQVGQLPIMRIGDVVHGARKVCELPNTKLTLILNPGESDSDEVRACDEVEPLTGWSGARPCHLLNPFEYSGVSLNPAFAQSRLVVFRRNSTDGGTNTFIMPRMTIFKAFYAWHNILANAFCENPWSIMSSLAISANTTRGGITTGVSDGGRQWNVVLQTQFDDDFAGILAALYFDKYAHARAESIYSSLLQEQQRHRRPQWYASAQIPLQAKIDNLKLALNCLQLRSWRAPDANGVWREHRKYLVTDISGTSWPAHYPAIGRTRTNSQEEGANVIAVDSSKPFAGSFASRDADEETLLRSDLDAHASSSTTNFKGNAWTWLDAGPKYIRLNKDLSHSYQGAIPRSTDNGTQVSAGIRTYETHTLPKAETKAVVRPSNSVFDDVHEALYALQESGTIVNVEQAPVRRPEQRSDRGRFSCWKFADDESLRNNCAPPPGFRRIYDRPYDRKSAHWRTALILQFDYCQRRIYWIEIERVRSQSYRSILLTIDDSLVVDHVIEAMLEAIAAAEGSKLKERLPPMFLHVPLQIFPYTHHYAGDAICLDHLRTFLKRNVGISL